MMEREITFSRNPVQSASASDEPDKHDTDHDGAKSEDAKLALRDRRKQPGHLDKKTRGQCVDQPLDDEKECESYQEILHPDASV